METLLKASALLRDFYALESRISTLSAEITGDTTDSTAERLHRASEPLADIIRNMIDTAAIVESCEVA